MGTNYYAIPKATDDLKAKIIKAVQDNEFAKLKRLIPDEFHIGKSSSGWPFLFNHNHWDRYESPKELFEFLEKCEIFDENGENHTVESFKSFVEEKQSIGIDKFTNSKYSSHYIIKDGYAFSTSTEFS